MQNHFSQEDWIDFARGLLSARQPELQAHLEKCKDCTQTAAIWSAVVTKTAEEWRYQPPRDAVQSAKAAFVLRGLHVRGSWPLRFAQIILDSAFAPSPAGVRSGAGQVRHLVLGVENLRIELIVEPAGGGPEQSVAITGQIMSEGKSPEMLSDGRILLAQDSEIVQTASVSENGEFVLNGRGDLPAWLVFDVEGKNPVAARLPLALEY